MKNWTTFALAGVILAAGTTLALAGQTDTHKISHQDTTAAHDDHSDSGKSTNDTAVKADKKGLAVESSDETTGKKQTGTPAAEGTTDHGKDGSITNAVKPNQKTNTNSTTTPASPH